MSKFKDFKIENVVKKQGPMTLREGYHCSGILCDRYHVDSARSA